MRRPYDNGQTVADEAAVLAEFVRRSEQVYRTYAHRGDVVYGSKPRSTLDVFEQSNALGTVVFIHGGYWQSCVKSDFACYAPAILGQGYQCILLEYDLAPGSRLVEIVQQVGQALDFLQQQHWVGSRVELMGSSAGAHLAACHITHPLVSAAHLISGIYDLRPIRDTHVNVPLQLSDEEVLQHSPAYAPQLPRFPVRIAYGALELPELKWQSINLFERWQSADAENSLVCQQLAGCNHFDVVDAYCARSLTIDS